MQKNGIPEETSKLETSKENQSYTKGSVSADVRHSKSAAVREPTAIVSELVTSSQWLKAPLKDITNFGMINNFSLQTSERSLHAEERSRTHAAPTSTYSKHILDQSHIQANPPKPNPPPVCIPQSLNSSSSFPSLGDQPTVRQPQLPCQQPNLHQLISSTKRRANDPHFGEKRQKVPHADFMETEYIALHVMSRESWNILYRRGLLSSPKNV